MTKDEKQKIQEDCTAIQNNIIEIADLKKQLYKLNNDYMILNYKWMENRDIINRAIKS